MEDISKVLGVIRLLDQIVLPLLILCVFGGVWVVILRELIRNHWVQ